MIHGLARIFLGNNLLDHDPHRRLLKLWDDRKRVPNSQAATREEAFCDVQNDEQGNYRNANRHKDF